MALKIGAAPCGDFGSFHAQPVDPRATNTEPVCQITRMVIANDPATVLLMRVLRW